MNDSFDVLDELLRRSATDALLERFFDTSTDFAGRTFVELEPGPKDEYTPADLFAVSLLDVRVMPGAARRLLHDPALRREVRSLLSKDDRDIWEASVDLGPRSPMWTLCDLLDSLPGIGETTACKLIARKRPRSVPVVDSVVLASVPAAPGKSRWELIQDYLRDSEVRSALRRRQPSSLPDDFPLLRVLDAAIWMWSSTAQSVRKVREQLGVQPLVVMR